MPTAGFIREGMQP